MPTSADYERRAALAWAAWERIIATDTESWSEGEREQHQIRTESLLAQAKELDALAARSGRRIFSPVTRVDG